MDPILLDIPMPIMTERLLITGPQVGEGAVVNAAIVESFAAINRWMDWAKVLPTPDETEKFMRESVANFVARRTFHLNIWNRGQTRLIGCTGLIAHNWSPKVFEIGYWTRKSEAGKGYMTEAVVAVADYAFKVIKADRVFIRCDDRNAASARVAEKAGFILEGVMRNDSLDNQGGLRSSRVYARTE
jgi:RimJ/RimL family protein N-acetyltransferase